MREIYLWRWSSCPIISAVVIFMLLTFLLGVGDTRAADDPVETADAVVLEHTISYEVNRNGDGAETVTGKIRINDADGKEYGNIVIDESGFLKLNRFAGAVYDMTGRLVYSCKTDDCHRICGYSGYSLYEDVCYRQYLLTASTYPYIVEYSYTREAKSLFFWPHWSPQEFVPVRLARYTVIVPSDTLFTFRSYGDMPSPVVTDSGQVRKYVWELTDIPPLADEDYPVVGSDDRMRLLLAPTHFRLGKYEFSCRDWDTLSRCYDIMFRSSLNLSKEQQALLAELPRDGTKRQICERLHEILTRRMRYVAIEIGLGGWQPCLASETFQRGYGDCKDLAVLYAAMLSALGIESKAAILKTRSSGVTDSTLTVVNRFNHVITMAIADNETIWIDPTCQICPVGDLPRSDEDVLALVVDSAGSGLVRTPSSAPFDNLTMRKAMIDIRPDKSIAVRLELAASGNVRHGLLSLLAEPDRSVVKAELQGDLIGLSSAFSIDSFTTPSASDQAPSATITVFGRMPNAVYLIGDKQYVSLDFIPLLRNCEESGLQDRTRPLELSYPRAFIDSLFLTIPPGWRPFAEESPVTIADDFGRLEYGRKTIDGSVIVTRLREASAYGIATDQLKTYKNHLQTLSNAVPKQIILYKITR